MIRNTDWMCDQIRRSHCHGLTASKDWIAWRKSVTALSRGNQCSIISSLWYIVKKPGLTSFQSCSPYSGGLIGGAGVAELRMAAMEDVKTTRFKVALALMHAPITFSVPFNAGSTNCLMGSVTPVMKNGDAVWKTKWHPLRRRAIALLGDRNHTSCVLLLLVRATLI